MFVPARLSQQEKELPWTTQLPSFSSLLRAGLEYHLNTMQRREGHHLSRNQNRIWKHQLQEGIQCSPCKKNILYLWSGQSSWANRETFSKLIAPISNMAAMGHGLAMEIPSLPCHPAEMNTNITPGGQRVVFTSRWNQVLELCSASLRCLTAKTVTRFPKKSLDPCFEYVSTRPVYQSWYAKCAASSWRCRLLQDVDDPDPNVQLERQKPRRWAGSAETSHRPPANWPNLQQMGVA